MIKRECERCAGKGNLPCFSSIQGGVCFLCGGKGHLITKRPHVASRKFIISAVCKADGERIVVCTISAKSEAEALRKAVAQLANGTGYIPSSAEAV